MLQNFPLLLIGRAATSKSSCFLYNFAIQMNYLRHTGIEHAVAGRYAARRLLLVVLLLVNPEQSG